MAHARYTKFLNDNVAELGIATELATRLAAGQAFEQAVSQIWAANQPYNPANYVVGQPPADNNMVFDTLINTIINNNNRATLETAFDTFFNVAPGTTQGTNIFQNPKDERNVRGDATYYKFMKDNDALLNQVPDLRRVLIDPTVKTALTKEWGVRPLANPIPDAAALKRLVAALDQTNNNATAQNDFQAIFGNGRGNGAIAALLQNPNSENQLRGDSRMYKFIQDLNADPKLSQFKDLIVNNPTLKQAIATAWGPAATLNVPPNLVTLSRALAGLPDSNASLQTMQDAIEAALGLNPNTIRTELVAAGIAAAGDENKYRGEAKYHAFLAQEAAILLEIPTLDDILKDAQVKNTLISHLGQAANPLPVPGSLDVLRNQLKQAPVAATAQMHIDNALGQIPQMSVALAAGALDAAKAQALFVRTQYNELKTTTVPAQLKTYITNSKKSVKAALATLDSAAAVETRLKAFLTADEANYPTLLANLGIMIPVAGGQPRPLNLLEIKDLYAEVQYHKLYEAHPELQTLLNANDVAVKTALKNNNPNAITRLVASIGKADTPANQAIALSALGITVSPIAGKNVEDILFAEKEYQRIVKDHPILKPLLEANRGDVNTPNTVLHRLAQLGSSGLIDAQIKKINDAARMGLIPELQALGIHNNLPAPGPGGALIQATADDFFAEREYKRIFDANVFLQPYLEANRPNVITALKGQPDRSTIDTNLVNVIKDANHGGMQAPANALGINLGIGGAALDYDEIYANKEYEKLLKRVPSNVQGWMEKRKTEVIAKIKGTPLPIADLEQLRKQILENSSTFDYQNKNNIAYALEKLGIIDTGNNNALNKKTFEKTHFDNAEHPYTRELFKQNQQSFSHVDDRPATYTYLLKHYRAVSVAAMNNQSAKEERIDIERKLVTIEEHLTRHRLILEAKLAKTGLSTSAYTTLQKKLKTTQDDLDSIKIVRENFAKVPAELTKIAYSGVQAAIVPIAAGTTMAAATAQKVQDYLSPNAVQQHIGTLANGATKNTTDTFSDSTTARVVQTEIKDENNQVQKFASVTGVENGVYQAQIYSNAAPPLLPDKDGLPHPQYLYWAHQEVENYMSGNPDPDSPVRLSGQFSEGQVKALYLEFALKGVEIINQVNDYKPKVSEIMALQNVQLKNTNLHFFTNDENKALAFSKGAVQKTEEALGISPETPKRPGSNH